MTNHFELGSERGGGDVRSFPQAVGNHQHREIGRRARPKGLKTAFLGQGGFDSQVRLLTLLTSNGSESVSVHLRFTCLLSLKSLAE